jgi:hypothetical protein
MTEWLRSIFSSGWMNQLLSSATAELPKVVAPLLLAGLGWYIGKRLTILWSYRQKRNEQDMIGARDFHALYGEFFSLWKLWNYYIRDVGADALPGASRWELLDRACRAEARLEATLVRLASERTLTSEQIATLGRFRQRYQQLRETIRDNKPLPWDHSEHPKYAEFKKLAQQAAAIVAGNPPVSHDLLTKITSNVYEVPNHKRTESSV